MATASKRAGFTQAYVPPPSGATLSLHALARIVSFFPNGVPRAFAAASPMARLAAETYRAEENYRWTPNGLVLREPGERETFDTYEARRERRAGVQLGRLIIVYHDALGHLERESKDVGQRDALAINPATAVMAQTAARERAGRQLQSLLEEERAVKSIFPIAGHEESHSSTGCDPIIETPAPTGGLLMQQPNHFSLVSFDSQRKNGEPVKVHYLPGPNRRSLYLWMDDEAEAGVDESPTTSPPLETITSIHQRDLSRKSQSRRITMKEALEASRWWLHRPCVSTLLYLHETEYAKTTSFLPPPPPSLNVHLYGCNAETIPLALETLLPPLQMLPSPSEDDLQRKAAQLSITCLDEQETRKAPSRICRSTVEPIKPPSDSERKKQQQQRSSIPCGVRSEVAKETAAIDALEEHTPDRVKGPVLEGLHLIGHPLMALHLSTKTAVQLAHRHLDELKVFKMNGIYADDTGIQALLQLHATQGRHLLQANTQTCIPVSPASQTVVATHSTTSRLEVADFGFCLAMTIFPLLVAPRDYNLASGSLSVITPIQHLRSLNLHGTSVANEVLVAVSSSCPGLEVLHLGSCQYLTDLHPLARMKRLRILDAHGTGVNDAGIASLTEKDFQALEELSLAGCTCLSEVTRLSHLSALRKLDLRHTPVRHGLSALKECTRLRELALSTDATAVEQLRHRQPELYKLDYFCAFHTLTALSLENMPQLTDEVLRLLTLSRAPLQSLLLHRVPQLTSIAALAGMPTLQYLTVERADALENSGLTLGALPKLERLILRRCSKLSNFNALHTLPALRYLDVRHNDAANITSESFQQFSMMSKHSPLEVLLASQYPKLTDLQPFRGLPLRVLDVRCTGITEEGLRTVLASRGAEALYLGYCTSLTKVGFLSRLPFLRTLDVSGTAINDHGLWELCHAPRLETLLLANCPGLKFQPFLHIFNAVRVLSLADNPQLTTKALKAFLHLSDESEEKFINPLFSTFAHVQDLDISRTAVDNVDPLVILGELKKLRARAAPITPAGLQHLSDIRGLELLDLRNVNTLVGELRPLFTQHSLQRLDLRGAELSDPTKVELPLPLLADSLLRELSLEYRRHHLQMLLPMLKAPQALRWLRLLLIEGGEDEPDAQAMVTEIQALRPLLSVRYI